MRNLTPIMILSMMIGLLLCLLLRTCLCNSVKPVHGDTISVKVDTVWKVSRAETLYTPRSYSIVSYRDRIVTRVDSLIEYELLPTDTAAILADYLATRFYSDTQRITYGSVIISDSVSRNRIRSRRLTTDFRIPEVTRTVTLTAPRRVQVYVGLNGANINSTLYGGSSLLLKTKRDLIFEVGAMYGTDRNILYTGGVKILLSLKRKR